VSLNAHNSEVYNKVCKPKFENSYESILKFIETSKKRLNTEITAVTIPEVNVKKLEEMAKKMGVKFRSRTYEGVC
jgi:TatD DNase family protein